MKIPATPHNWLLTPNQAIAVQSDLRAQVRLCPLKRADRVMGLDCAFAGDRIFAVAVLWDVVRERIIETRGASLLCRFPYLPGLLSFREMPVLLQALKRVQTPFDVVMCDGQGIAHPRRFGIASHLGVILGMPTLGCAKSRLIGEHDPLDQQRGARKPLLDPRRDGKFGPGSRRIGTVLRTRTGVKPLFISPGHLCDHTSAIGVVLACGAGYRLPEPTRQADRLVAGFKRDGYYRGGVC